VNWGFRTQASSSREETGAPVYNAILLGTTQVSLRNDISFRPAALAGCTSVTDDITDGQTDHATVTCVAIGRIAFSDVPKNVA